MCGIAGYCGLAGNADALRRMTDAIARRGPDDAFYYEQGVVGFGFRRLSIIDVEGGRQPLSNEDGSVWVMMNGEVYDYKKVRSLLVAEGHVFRTHSDTEVLVHAYEKWGEEFIRHVDGMFAIALWDVKKEKLFLIRDRMGKKPLYWGIVNNTLWFGSELKALLASSAFSYSLHQDAFRYYLQAEHVPTPLSFFEGIYKLEPGTVRIWEQGTFTKVYKYWSPQIKKFFYPEEERELLNCARLVIDGAVKRRLVADVPLGLFLSGGLDSSIIAESASRQSEKTLQAFTIGFSDASHDESSSAQFVSNAFGLQHRLEIFSDQSAFKMLNESIRCLDEPLADPSIVPQMLLAQMTKKHVKVALAGDGGDELLLGYQHLPVHYFAQRFPFLWKHLGLMKFIFSRIPSSEKYFSLGFKTQRLSRGIGYSFWERDARWRGAWLPEYVEKACINLNSESYTPESVLKTYANELDKDATLWQAWSFAYLRTFLMDQVMVKVDRATMWMGLEARAPLLDSECVSFFLGLPDKYKMGKWKGKALFKKILKDKLPMSILERSKHGFGVPTALWLKEGLRSELEDFADTNYLIKQGVFNPRFMQHIIRQHQKGWIDRRKELWTFYMFQKWYENWFVKKS